jgi:hypothetical protein
MKFIDALRKLFFGQSSLHKKTKMRRKLGSLSSHLMKIQLRKFGKRGGAPAKASVRKGPIFERKFSRSNRKRLTAPPRFLAITGRK